MSKYTTEVRFICETKAGYNESVGADSVNEIIQKARAGIFDSSYPIFDEAYRGVLEAKILKHYYTREIAFETTGLWKLKLNTKMEEIMSYFNQLYKSELLTFNPFYDTELSKSQDRENTEVEKNIGTVTDSGTNTNTLNSTDTVDRVSIDNETQIVDTTNDGTINKTDTGEATQETTQKVDYDKAHMDAYSDTPQGGVEGLEEQNYLTNARKIHQVDKTTDSSDVATTNTETSVGTTKDVSNTVVDKSNSSTLHNDKVVSTVDTLRKDNTTNTNMNKDILSLDKYVETVSGKQGSKSYSELLQEFRKTFMNIDMMVIEELSDMFFTLW